MLKKITKSMVLLIMTLGLIAGCGTKKVEVEKIDANPKGDNVVQEVVDAITSQPGTLDPAVCNGIDEMNIDAMMFEGLYRKGLNGQVELGMAEEVNKSPDNLTYTFKIRKDARWSEGKPLTAYDFEYAWKRVITPGFETDVDYMMYFIKNAEKYKKGESKEVGIKAIDANTLEVKLEKPTPYFEQILTFHSYYPVRKDIVEKDPKNWWSKEETLIGNGPFKLSKWEKGTNIPFIEVVKNESYWDSKNVKLNKVTTKVIDGAEAQWESFRQGKIDIGLLIPKDKDINQLLEDKQIVSAPTLTTEYYQFNLARKPFDNIKVRKAISMVIDRQKIITDVKKGAKPATGYVPYGIPDTTSGQDFRQVGGNLINPEVTEAPIKEAQKLLAEAGYPGGKGFPKIKLIVNNTTRNNEIASIFKENLKKNLNIDVEVVSLETDLFKKERDREENFDITRVNWVADFADASNFLEVLVSDSSNSKGSWANKEYDKLVTDASKTLDEAARMEKLHQAEKIMIDDACIMPIYFDSNIYYFKPYVMNFTRSSLEEKNFRIVYIDKKN